jgi:TolB-like protein/class 3 adenylate cyclase/Flp pilus assembly protein TadD
MGETRKLAAILVSDIVGYSRLAGADEDRILARLRTLRSDLIDPIIAVHHGRIVKRTGDGSIIEFRSVVDAVRCAIEAQSGMAARNAGVPADERIEYRVGVHLGDVVEEADGDLMGDGVNIASRLEGLSEPGGLCLSAAAYEQVRDRLKETFADLGEKQLKNIARPVRVFALPAAAIGAAKTGAASLPPAPPVKTLARSSRLGALAAALTLVLIAAGAYAWHSGLAPRFTAASVDDKLANAPRLSIVVLPFENLSGDKEQDYFADGITDDLTTDLSHLDGSFVISRGTAFTYKGKPVDAKQIGKDLGVRYLLEGSVRRLGEKVEVNAQLISTETGAHVWADRFDGEKSKLGELQVEVVSRLANSLGVELVKAEALRATRERPENPDALDLRLRGFAILNSNATKATLNEAKFLFERARALDPTNVPAMVGLAATLNWRANVGGWSDNPTSDIALAEQTIDVALALQPDNSSAHQAKGWNFYAKRQWGPALAEAEAAIADDPNNAGAQAAAGYWKMFVGRAEDGVAELDTAFRLSPRDPAAPYWRLFLCRLHTHSAQWEKAIDSCNKAVAGGARDFGALNDLAAAYAWTGRDKRATDIVTQAFKLDSGFVVDQPGGLSESDDPTFKEQSARIVEGLRKAGSPDVRSVLAEAENVIADDPNNAKAYADAGHYKMYLGRSAEGVADVETALRLSPNDSLAPDWQSRLCYLRAHLAQWEQAIEQCQRAVGLNVGDWGALADLTTAYAWTGRDNEAKDVLAQLRKVNPSFTSQWAQTLADTYAAPAYKMEMGRIKEGVRRAEAPEGQGKTN